MMGVRLETLALIGAMAAVTYALRAGGLLLAGRLPQTPGFKAFMEALPGAILVALVMPGVLHAGVWGGVAAGAAAFCAYKTKNVFLAMVVGMVIVAAQRGMGW